MSTKPDKVALRPGLVVEVMHADTDSLFGRLTTWWVTFNGVACCGDLELERRHLDRMDALQHGRTYVQSAKWST